MIENSYSAHKNLQLWTWFIKNVHNSYVCEAVCTKPRGLVWWRQIRMLLWKWNRDFMDLNVMMTFYKYKPFWAVRISPWDRKTFRAIQCFNPLSLDAAAFLSGREKKMKIKKNWPSLWAHDIPNRKMWKNVVPFSLFSRITILVFWINVVVS